LPFITRDEKLFTGFAAPDSAPFQTVRQLPIHGFDHRAKGNVGADCTREGIEQQSPLDLLNILGNKIADVSSSYMGAGIKLAA
jgi:hypothetical protein